MSFIQTLTSFEFYQQRKSLRDGAYLVIEHDESISVAIVEDIVVKWMTEDEYVELLEKESLNFLYANDGLDLLYGDCPNE